MAWFLRFVGLFVVVVGWIPREASGALLVVGSVSPTTARVLYDPVGADPIPTLARVFIRSSENREHAVYEADQEIELPLADAAAIAHPQVLKLDGLMPNRRYLVAFEFNGQQQQEIVRFRTSSSSSANPVDNRVLVVSCDRFVEDRDDAMWLKIHDDLQENGGVYFGVAHIGDQVYVDAGDDRVPLQAITSEVAGDPTALQAHYEAIVEQFRAIYRETLGRPAAQRVLRQGAHWMLPDDHEILNNFNTYLVDKAFNEAEGDANPGSRLGLQLHIRAGMQTVYEYQYQLRDDVAWGDVDFFQGSLESIISQYPLYFSVDVDALKLFFLDIRFDRSYAIREERAGLVPERQLHDLRTSLSSWSEPKDPRTAVVVLAGMPLFFHSPLTATIAYTVEKELYPGHSEHMPGLIDLYDLFHQSIGGGALKLLVGGDVHALAHSRVCGFASDHTVRRDRGARRCIDQLTTSGLTNGSTAINDPKLIPFYFLITRLIPLWNALMRPLGFVSHPPWVVNSDRVFLGRNYGVLELSSNGTFEWRNSVTMDHETPGNSFMQVVFDWVDTHVIGAVVVVLALRRTMRLVLTQEGV